MNALFCLRKILLVSPLLYFRSLNAQTGTYSKGNKNGASCTVAVTRAGNSISADIFAWWHTSSGRHGAFSGEGILQNNKAVLKGKDEGDDCVIHLNFASNSVTLLFSDCITYNLPEDFSGTFHLLTEMVPGNYMVSASQAYFYRTPDTNHRMKAYLVKGNKVSVDIENMADKDWVFINYTNASGQVTSGYISWLSLKKI